MSKLDENIDELQKLATFGQAVLDAVKESGLVKQKRRTRRQATQATIEPKRRRRRTKEEIVKATVEVTKMPPVDGPAKRPVSRRDIAQPEAPAEE